MLELRPFSKTLRWRTLIIGGMLVALVLASSASLRTGKIPAAGEVSTPPSGLTATVTGDAVTLSWSHPLGALFFIAGDRIYRDGQPIGSTDIATTEYKDTGVPAGFHYYSVATYTILGSGPESKSVAVSVVFEPSRPSPMTTTTEQPTSNLSGSSGVAFAKSEDALCSVSQPSDPCDLLLPWFPQAWNQQGMMPFTKYHPSLGLYDSGSPAVVDQQIRSMQYGNIQVGIVSWWGKDSITDRQMPLLLHEAAGTGFRWTLYYEAEGNAAPGVVGSPNPTVAEIASDLSYIKTRYASDATYLHVNGKPVIFVYGDSSDNCSTVERWKEADTQGFYVQLKVFPGYAQCPSQPDSWHQYAPSTSADAQVGYSFSVSPGFNKANETSRGFNEIPLHLVSASRRWLPREHLGNL